jgi:hypothetical protein
MVDVGALYRSTYTVYDNNNALTDPSTVALSLFTPNGTIVTPAPVIGAHDSIGVYHYDYLTTVVGRHTGIWSTTGPTTVRGFSFEVDPVASTTIINLSEIKLHLNISPSNTADDDELMEFVRAATDIVESKVGNVVARTIVERQNGNQASLWLKEPPVISITSITPWKTFGAGYSVNLVKLDKSYGRVERLDGYPFVGGPFEVTYRSGREFTPPAVSLAVKMIIDHLWTTQRGKSEPGSYTPGPEEDVIMFAMRGKEYTVPRMAMELLTPDGLQPRSG